MTAHELDMANRMLLDDVMINILLNDEVFFNRYGFCYTREIAIVNNLMPFSPR